MLPIVVGRRRRHADWFKARLGAVQAVGPAHALHDNVMIDRDAITFFVQSIVTKLAGACTQIGHRCIMNGTLRGWKGGRSLVWVVRSWYGFGINCGKRSEERGMAMIMDDDDDEDERE